MGCYFIIYTNLSHPGRGRYVRELIRSLLASAALISQKGLVCQATSKHMTEVRIRNTTSRSFRQQPKWNVGRCHHDLVEIHHIKQREGESTEDFVQRFKVESRDVKGAPKVMRISGFMYRITNPELIKHLHDKILKSVDEMMRITTSFLRGELIVGNQERKKSLPHDATVRMDISKTSRNEVLKVNKGLSGGRTGHNTNECMHLKRQIEELLKSGKLSHVIKEIKQNSEKDQPKTSKKREASNKDKPLAILMVQPCHYPLIGFNGEIISSLGQISLLVKIGDEEHSTLAWMNFVMVRSSSPYNRIIGRPGIKKIQAVPLTTHGMLKFPVAGGILTLKSSKIIPIECAAVSKVEGQPLAISQAVEERIKVAIHPEYPEQTIMFGSTLTEDGRSKLCDLLRRNLDVFAWKPADMTGVPRHIAEHRLNVREGCPPIRQNKRGATYQSLMDKSFQPRQIGKPGEEGNVIMYKVNTKGIKVCPDKADAVLSLPSPKCLKDVQKLKGKLASLNRFLAKSAEKSLPFFKTLKKCTKKSDFAWTEEAESAFKQMKQHIAKLPMLTATEEKEELIVHLAATKEAVSAVLMTEREAKQIPVYFVNRALRGPEINYTSMEKLVLALVHSSNV
ncbi:reverse transcriptase domain-containing protein [Tanacetum coccineum]